MTDLQASRYGYQEDTQILGHRVILPNPDTSFLKAGFVVSFKAVAFRAGSLRLQIWRPVSNGGIQTYELVGSSPTYDVSEEEFIAAGGLEFHVGKGYLEFEAGDRLGIEVMDVNPIAVHIEVSQQDKGKGERRKVKAKRKVNMKGER